MVSAGGWYDFPSLVEALRFVFVALLSGSGRCGLPSELSGSWSWAVCVFRRRMLWTGECLCVAYCMWQWIWSSGLCVSLTKKSCGLGNAFLWLGVVCGNEHGLEGRAFLSQGGLVDLGMPFCGLLLFVVMMIVLRTVCVFHRKMLWTGECLCVAWCCP